MDTVSLLKGSAGDLFGSVWLIVHCGSAGGYKLRRLPTVLYITVGLSLSSWASEIKDHRRVTASNPHQSHMFQLDLFECEGGRLVIALFNGEILFCKKLLSALPNALEYSANVTTIVLCLGSCWTNLRNIMHVIKCQQREFLIKYCDSDAALTRHGLYFFSTD